MDDREQAEELALLNNKTKLLKKVNRSRAELVKQMEEFENRIKKTYDKVLGTPKEVEWLQRKS